jgi:hypothetical protein
MAAVRRTDMAAPSTTTDSHATDIRTFRCGHYSDAGDIQPTPTPNTDADVERRR